LLIFPLGHLNCARAYAGQTLCTSAETVFDTEDFNEKEYLQSAQEQSGNLPLTMNWFVAIHLVMLRGGINIPHRYNSFKVAALFCLGHHDAAAELGFMVYETRHKHPK
jgi:hypothetical protein